MKLLSSAMVVLLACALAGCSGKKEEELTPIQKRVRQHLAAEKARRDAMTPEERAAEDKARADAKAAAAAEKARQAAEEAKQREEKARAQALWRIAGAPPEEPACWFSREACTTQTAQNWN